MLRHALAGLLLAAIACGGGCLAHPPYLDPACRQCTEPVPEKPPVVKIYDLSDFVGGKNPLSDGELCDRIRSSIALGTWDWEGHSLGCQNGKLTVRHNPEIQGRVVELIHDLRRQIRREREAKRHQE